MRELGARHLEQKPSMTPFGELARRDVLFPRAIRDDPRDFVMALEDFDRIVGARIVVSHDRIAMGPEVVERVGQEQRLVADAREGDEDMLCAAQRRVARYDPFAVTELPAHAQGPTGANTVCAAATPLSRKEPSRRNSCSDRRL